MAFPHRQMLSTNGADGVVPPKQGVEARAAEEMPARRGHDVCFEPHADGAFNPLHDLLRVWLVRRGRGVGGGRGWVRGLLGCNGDGFDGGEGLLLRLWRLH